MTDSQREENRPLRFKPITEGLGFHPFSDGLPYAPLSPTQSGARPDYSRGSGAVAAGPVAFARVQVPVARHIPIASTPIEPRLILQREPEIKVTLPTESQIPVEPHYGMGYLAARVAAFFADLVLNTLLCGGALYWVLLKQSIPLDLLLNPGIIALAALFFLVFHWSIVTAQEIAFSTTLGKRLFGLSLEGSVGATVFRSLLFIVSCLFCGIGLLWAVFDSRRRCWHDIVSDLQPGRITDAHTERT